MTQTKRDAYRIEANRAELVERIVRINRTDGKTRVSCRASFSTAFPPRAYTAFLNRPFV
ncbi:MAG: hypothetical protein R2911_06960 [Caldilineaceae bacterium]